jgi:hypothetical protein
MTAPVKPKKTGGRDFVPGHDPRRNVNGKPKGEFRVSEIKGEIRHKFMEFLNTYFHTDAATLNTLINDPKLTVGEKMAARFLQETARLADSTRLSLFLKVFGLEIDRVEHIDASPKIQVTIEDLKVALNKDAFLAIEDKSNE